MFVWPWKITWWGNIFTWESKDSKIKRLEKELEELKKDERIRELQNEIDRIRKYKFNDISKPYWLNVPWI